MFKGKKLIMIVVLATVVIAGSIGGVVLAQSDTTTPKVGPGMFGPGGPQSDAVLNRAAEIYKEKTGATLDVTQLKDSLAQAAKELQGQAFDARLKQMVDSGKITQQQADEMKQWMESRPADLPPGPARGFGRMGRGMMGRGFMKGFGGCVPAAPAPAPSNS